MNATSILHREPHLRIAIGLMGALALGACASMPPPTSNMQAAHQAIAGAEQAEAARYAPAELSQARAKLAAANTAVSAQRMTMAARLAEESQAEAELATSRSAQVKAETANDDMKRSTRILITEMQRSSGETP
ncbi:MAG TPA: DUF4398 domain-containing protein [Steroidobacteraceae bacterium]|jgi:multidrug efflux pump subunit AcrA (membrane-fusion protein)|nr:DUF4398 domain-containing protein [Steroidobacteraceae bacterium]